MKRACDCCGEGYEAKTSRSRYCSERCKRRYHRGARPAEAKKKKAAKKQTSSKKSSGRSAGKAEPSGIGSTSAATMLELQEAKRLHTPLGQAALVLAYRLDMSQMDTGAGVASLAKQLQATLAAAVADAEVGSDPVDELERRRQEKIRAVTSG